MIKRSTITFALLAALGACAESPTVGNPGGTPPGGTPPGEQTKVELAGKYEVTSHFDISIKDFAKGAEFAKILDEVADDPYGAVADRIASGLSFDLFSSIIEQVLAEVLGPEIEQEVQDFAQSILDISGSFDVVTMMTVTGSGESFTVTHQAVGMDVQMGGDNISISFEGQAPAAGSTTIKVSGTKMAFEQHDLDIPYAKMLGAMVDSVVVPFFDPNADDIGEALSSIVDCATLSYDLQDSGLIPGFGAAALRIACEVGLSELGDQVYERIDAMDNLRTMIKMSGNATYKDENGNGKADSFEGAWDGTFDIAGAATYAGASRFTARRVQ